MRVEDNELEVMRDTLYTHYLIFLSFQDTSIILHDMIWLIITWKLKILLFKKIFLCLLSSSHNLFYIAYWLLGIDKFITLSFVPFLVFKMSLSKFKSSI